MKYWNYLDCLWKMNLMFGSGKYKGKKKKRKKMLSGCPIKYSKEN